MGAVFILKCPWSRKIVAVDVLVVVVVGVFCLLSHMFMYLFNLCVFTFFFYTVHGYFNEMLLLAMQLKWF